MAQTEERLDLTEAVPEWFEIEVVIDLKVALGIARILHPLLE